MMPIAEMPGTWLGATKEPTCSSRRDDSWKPAANAAMDRLAMGDDGAFSEVYDALAPRLHAFLLRQTRDAEVSADLLQQTLLQMYAARRHFTPGAEVLPWAFAICRRLVIDRARRRSRDPVVPESPGDPEAADEPPSSRGDCPEESLARSQLSARIERELARLPEANRIAFELVKREQLSMAEAAEVLGTTVTAVKLRAHRAYLALRTALADTMDEWQE
jgi:RNA polymerase sigma-70 factor (ECF subfamily)